MSSSAVVSSSFRPDTYFFRWIRQAIPHSIVAVETSEGPPNSFLNHLLDEGWRALLLESNQALCLHLQDKWKEARQIDCVWFSPKSMHSLGAGPKSLGSILREGAFTEERGSQAALGSLGSVNAGPPRSALPAFTEERGSQAALGSSGSVNAGPPRSALPAFTEERGSQAALGSSGSVNAGPPRSALPASVEEFGLLILNSPERRCEQITELRESGFYPRLIAVQDGSELPGERCPLYEVLIANGYRFAGTQQQFSLWTRAQIAEDLRASLHREIPPPTSGDPGMVCFDAAGSQNRFGAAGHLEVELSGWAFLDPSRPVPPHVYVEITDVRTGHTDYVTASRFPRLDVSRHFNNPDLLMSGFEAVLPMGSLHPNGLRVRVIQGDGQNYYSSASELTIDRGFEDFELTARQGLARKFLRGSGIEIGALQRKLELPYGCRVRYLDRMHLADLLEHYPEMRQFPLQAPDLVDNGEQLATIAERSLDFLVANHFFEHSENPVKTMENFLRVLKPHGILFMAVPDKRYTFDARRPSTNFDTIRATYQSGVRPDRTHLYSEWVEFVEMNTGPERESRITALLQDNYSIHFNVWSADELLSFLLQARQEFALPFNISSVVCSDNEIILLLERAA